VWDMRLGARKGAFSRFAELVGQSMPSDALYPVS
jgi:hypothetical protein